MAILAFGHRLDAIRRPIDSPHEVGHKVVDVGEIANVDLLERRHAETSNRAQIGQHVYDRAAERLGIDERALIGPMAGRQIAKPPLFLVGPYAPRGTVAVVIRQYANRVHVGEHFQQERLACEETLDGVLTTALEKLRHRERNAHFIETVALQQIEHVAVFHCFAVQIEPQINSTAHAAIKNQLVDPTHNALESAFAQFARRVPIHKKRDFGKAQHIGMLFDEQTVRVYRKHGNVFAGHSPANNLVEMRMQCRLAADEPYVHRTCARQGFKGGIEVLERDVARPRAHGFVRKAIRAMQVASRAQANVGHRFPPLCEKSPGRQASRAPGTPCFTNQPR